MHYVRTLLCFLTLLIASMFPSPCHSQEAQPQQSTFPWASLIHSAVAPVSIEAVALHDWQQGDATDTPEFDKAYLVGARARYAIGAGNSFLWGERYFGVGKDATRWAVGVSTSLYRGTGAR